MCVSTPVIIRYMLQYLTKWHRGYLKCLVSLKKCALQAIAWPSSTCPWLLRFAVSSLVLLLFESGFGLKLLETEAGLKCDLNCMWRIADSLFSQFSFWKRSLLVFSQPYRTCNLWLPSLKKKKCLCHYIKHLVFINT